MFLSGDVIKPRSAVGAQFERHVKKYVRASGQVDGPISDVNHMEDGAPRARRYPSGCKQGVFKLSTVSWLSFVMSAKSYAVNANMPKRDGFDLCVLHDGLEVVTERRSSLKPLG